MIDETYFNGDRDRIFAMWSKKALSVGIVAKKDEKVVSFDSVSLPVEEKNSIIHSVGYEYLTPFSSEAKKVEEIPGAVVKYEVPGNFEKEKDKLEIPRHIVSLDYNVVCGVTDALLGGSAMGQGVEEQEENVSNFDTFEYGSLPCNGFVPAPPYADTSSTSGNSGQMKLLVDFALAIDEMIEERKKQYRILVIGCGSPGGVRSGIAYSIVPFVCNAIVDMFDPYEVTRNYDVQANYTVKYNVYGVKFVYGVTAVKVKYDLIVDDSWERGKTRNSRDPDDWVTSSKCFSIKQFPWERSDRKGNIYIQRFYTDGLEERRVSRNVTLHASRDHDKLGRCVSCRELRFRLRNRYSSEYYTEIMNLHVKNCLTGAREYIEVITQFSSWVRVEPFVIDYSNYCSLNYDYVDGTKMVSPGVKGSSELRFIFTDVRNVPERIQVNAYQILVVNAEEGIFLVNKVISERIYNKVNIEKREGVVNLAHTPRDSPDGRQKPRKKKGNGRIVGKIQNDTDWTSVKNTRGRYRKVNNDK